MSEKLKLYSEMCNALRSIDRIIEAELDWGNYDETIIRKAYNKLNAARVIMYHELSYDDAAAYQRKINRGESGMESRIWK